MTRIDYYFTTVSPYVYLAGTRLEAIAARHGAEVSYRPVDALAVFSRTGGQPLAQRHESRRAYRLQDLRRQAALLDMPITLAPAYFPANPAPSAYAIIAAAKAGGGDLGALVHAFARAVWAEERNIAEDEVVKDILAAHGYDPKLADTGMFMAAGVYEKNLEDAIAQGVFGLPFYVVGEERFWGQDRLDQLDLHLGGKL